MEGAHDPEKSEAKDKKSEDNPNTEPKDRLTSEDHCSVSTGDTTILDGGSSLARVVENADADAPPHVDVTPTADDEETFENNISPTKVCQSGGDPADNKNEKTTSSAETTGVTAGKETFGASGSSKTLGDGDSSTVMRENDIVNAEEFSSKNALTGDKIGKSEEDPTACSEKVALDEVDSATSTAEKENYIAESSSGSNMIIAGKGETDFSSAVCPEKVPLIDEGYSNVSLGEKETCIPELQTSDCTKTHSEVSLIDVQAADNLVEKNTCNSESPPSDIEHSKDETDPSAVDEKATQQSSKSIISDDQQPGAVDRAKPNITGKKCVLDNEVTHISKIHKDEALDQSLEEINVYSTESNEDSEEVHSNCLSSGQTLMRVSESTETSVETKQASDDCSIAVQQTPRSPKSDGPQQGSANNAKLSSIEKYEDEDKISNHENDETMDQNVVETKLDSTRCKEDSDKSPKQNTEHNDSTDQLAEHILTEVSQPETSVDTKQTVTDSFTGNVSKIQPEVKDLMLKSLYISITELSVTQQSREKETDVVVETVENSEESRHIESASDSATDGLNTSVVEKCTLERGDSGPVVKESSEQSGETSSGSSGIDRQMELEQTKPCDVVDTRDLEEDHSAKSDYVDEHCQESNEEFSNPLRYPENRHDDEKALEEYVSECLKDIVSRIAESGASENAEVECQEKTSLVKESTSNIGESQPFDTSHLENEFEEPLMIDEVHSPSRTVKDTDEDSSSQICNTQPFDTSHLEFEAEREDTPLPSPECSEDESSEKDQVDKPESEKLSTTNEETGTINGPKMITSSNSKASDVASSPAFILSSPFTQTIEEYNALGHMSPSSEKYNHSEGNGCPVQIETVLQSEESAEHCPDCAEDNSDDDGYGETPEETRCSKQVKAKSPEKGHVFIGFSKRKQKFKCFLCDEIGAGTSFEEHVMQHILWKPYKCLYCGRSQYFITRADIQKHVSEAHKGQLPKCGLRAIKKAKEYMEHAQKEGTFKYMNERLNNMYWSCKKNIIVMMAEKGSEKPHTDKPGGPDERSEASNVAPPAESEESNEAARTVTNEMPNSANETLNAESTSDVNTIQPRSLDFVAQLTKPQIDTLISLYHEDSQPSTSRGGSSEADHLTRNESALKEVPSAVRTLLPNLLMKPVPNSLVNAVTFSNQTALSYTPNTQSSVITAVSKLSTSPKQVASGPSIIQIVSPPNIQHSPSLPQTQLSTPVVGQLPTSVVSRILVPMTFAPAHQPFTRDIHGFTGNNTGVLGVSNISSNPTALTSIRMPVTPIRMPIPFSNSSILTIIPSQPPLASSNMLSTPTNPLQSNGQNTSCGLILVPSAPIAQQSGKVSITTQEKPEQIQSTGLSRSHYPNILSKSPKQKVLPLSIEKKSVSSEMTPHTARINQPSTFTVGIVNDEFLCFLCKEKHRSETSFRAHLWNHVHAERKACEKCVSSMSATGRKTLACAKTEDYIDRLKNNKIGNMSRVEVVMPSMSTTPLPGQSQDNSEQKSAAETLAAVSVSNAAEKDRTTRLSQDKSEQSLVLMPQGNVKQDSTGDTLNIPRKSTSVNEIEDGNTSRGTIGIMPTNPLLEENEKSSNTNHSSHLLHASENRTKGHSQTDSVQKGNTGIEDGVSSLVKDKSTKSPTSHESDLVTANSTRKQELAPKSRVSKATVCRKQSSENRDTVDTEVSNSDNTPSTSGQESQVNRDTVESNLSKTAPVNRDAKTIQSASASRETTTTVSKEQLSVEKQNTKWKFYVCGANCGFSSLYPNDLKKHVGECLMPNSLLCNHCQYFADSPNSLMRHMYKHYSAHEPGTAVHSCFVSGCKYTTNILQGFCNHILSFHPDVVSFECSHCGESFPENRLLMEHLLANILHVVNCIHCSAKDLTKPSIMSHISIYHPNKSRMVNMVKQLLCKERKENEKVSGQMQSSILQTSVTSNCLTGDNSEKSDDVDDSLIVSHAADESAKPQNSEGSVLKPVADDRDQSDVTCPLSQEPVYECSLCSYVGLNNHDLNTHITKHADHTTKVLAFSCPKCPEEFSFLSNFEIHLRKHAKPLKYGVHSCKICKNNFGSREEVEKHIKALHQMVIGDGKEFADFKLKVSNTDVVNCTVCSFKCLSKENMVRHNEKFHLIELSQDASKDAKNIVAEEANADTPNPQIEVSQNSEISTERLQDDAKVKLKMHIPSSTVFVTAVRCVKCNYSSVYKGNVQRHVNHFHPDIELIVEEGKMSSPVKHVVEPFSDVEEPDGSSLKIGCRLLDVELEWLYENHVSSFKCMMCLKDIQRKNLLHGHLLDHLGSFLWKCSLCDFKTSRRIAATYHVSVVHPGQHDTEVIVPMVDEIKMKIKSILGEVVEGAKRVEDIRPTIGKKELDDELRNKYKVIGKKKICKTCEMEYQSTYAIHSHILRKHLKQFMFKCSYCNLTAVDRYSVAKHTTEKHADKENVVRYDPRGSRTNEQRNEKQSKKTSSGKPSQLEQSRILSEESVHVPNEEDHIASDTNLPKSGTSHHATEQTVTSMHDSVHHCSGKTLLPHDSETRNELRTGSDHLDQKLKALYDVKQGRERILVCKICHTEHHSKYTLHCDLLGHLGINLVACPYCTFESIENKQLKEHISANHPNDRVYFLFLKVNIEEYVSKYCEEHVNKSKNQFNKNKISPKTAKPSLSQLLVGRKVKSPSKLLKSPEKLTKYVVPVTDKGIKKFKCKLCNYVALTKNSVGTHVFKDHENFGKTNAKTVTQKSTVPERMVCEFCTYKTTVPELLRTHYKQKHSQGDSDDDCNLGEIVAEDTSDKSSDTSDSEKTRLKAVNKDGEIHSEKKSLSNTTEKLKKRKENRMDETDAVDEPPPEKKSLSNTTEKLEKRKENRMDESDAVDEPPSEKKKLSNTTEKLKKRKENRMDETDAVDEPPSKKMKVKTDAVTYSCTKCDFKDESKSSGVNHLKTEHGVTKVMQCAYCTASYVYEDKLKSHISFFHKGKTMNYNLLPVDSMLIESKQAASKNPSNSSSSNSHTKPKSTASNNPKKFTKGPSSQLTKDKSSHSTEPKHTSECDVKSNPNLDKTSSKQVKSVLKHSSSAITKPSTEQISKQLPEKANSASKPSTTTKISTEPKTKPLPEKAKSASKSYSSTTKDLTEQKSKPLPEEAKSISKHSSTTTKTSSEQRLKQLTDKAKSAPKGPSKHKTNPSKSGSKTSSSQQAKKQLTLPPYVPDSPDNSEDERVDYYKYLCVYCDFKASKKSEMKIHIAKHTIDRLYKGKLPGNEEAKLKIKQKVRDIMPICIERARNKEMKLMEETTDKDNDQNLPKTMPTVEKQSPMKKADVSKNLPKAKANSEKQLSKKTATTDDVPQSLPKVTPSPKKRPAGVIEKDVESREESSDEESIIAQPKKMRRVKRVISSSDDASDTEEQSKLSKDTPFPSGGQLTYCCNVCPYNGKSLYKFRSHLATHGTFKYLNADMANESVLKCGFCGFLADDKEDFSSHVEKHLDGRMYKCGYCKYDSYHSKNMRSHLKNKHRHKPEKIIDLRQVLKERARRPTQRAQLVNLDPELRLTNALGSFEFQNLLDEAGCKTLDMPLDMLQSLQHLQNVDDMLSDHEIKEEEYDDYDYVSNDGNAVVEESDDDDCIILS